MTFRLSKTVPLFLLLSVALGCKFFDQIQKKIEEGQKPKIITSSEGKTQLTVPGNWELQKDLNDDATLQAANLRAEQYTVVISESKDDFTNEMDLNGFAAIVRENLRSTKITTPIISEQSPLTVNGYPALQFEVTGSVDNIKARWLYTLVDAPKNYHQIIAWTLNSKYEANKPVFIEVINSFKEIENLTMPLSVDPATSKTTGSP